MIALATSLRLAESSADALVRQLRSARAAAATNPTDLRAIRQLGELIRQAETLAADVQAAREGAAHRALFAARRAK